MQAYEECLAPYGIRKAQILLTREISTTGALSQCAQHHLDPLRVGLPTDHHENDTVSVRRSARRQRPSERNGDQPLQAPCYPSNRGGWLCRTDPTKTPTPRCCPPFPNDGAVMSLAGGVAAASDRAECEANFAQPAWRRGGESVVLANGTRPTVLDDLFAGNQSARSSYRTGVQCRFGTAGSAIRASKGKARSDGGQSKRSTKRRSLLPIGVVRVVGDVQQGRCCRPKFF